MQNKYGETDIYFHCQDAARIIHGRKNPVGKRNKYGQKAAHRQSMYTPQT
jgi:hypothetical protein